MQNEQSRLMLAVVLSLVVLFMGQYLVDFFRPEPELSPGRDNKESVGAPVPSLPPVSSASQEAVLDHRTALHQSPRIRIETPKLKGSIALRGARFDDLTLPHYKEMVSAQSPSITLLAPVRTSSFYYASFSWASPGQIKGEGLPDETTLWTADRDQLTPDQPVTLRWKNKRGVLFEQIISVDKDYMFSITQRVTNGTNASFAVAPRGEIVRSVASIEDEGGNMMSYEGPLSGVDGSIKEIGYDAVKSKGRIQDLKRAAWMGLTDKFWLTALIPDQRGQAVTTSFNYLDHGTPRYTAFFVGEAPVLHPGGVLETKAAFFGGAKVLRLLDQYEEQYGIKHFDLAVDFGWFYFLTKPIFYALTWLKDLTGNFGFAILLFTVLMKLLFFPLANKSYHSMGRMKALQPEIEKIRARYKDDPARLNQEVMKLYKREKVNPVSGCLPMLVQIPAFFALYKVLFISIEMRHAPFFGWIKDLSAPDPTTFANLFGLIPWDPPGFLQVGALALLMGLSMYVQQKMNPPPADPVQAKVFQYGMPLIFTYTMAGFASGLLIYWTWSNVLSIAQQAWITQKDRKSKSLK